jgi:hypothetical protein
MCSLMLSLNDSPGSVPGGLGEWAARQVSSGSSSSSTSGTSTQCLLFVGSHPQLHLDIVKYYIILCTLLLYAPLACCRLGHGTETSELFPRIVQALAGSRVAHVAAGGAHTAVATGKHRVKLACKCAAAIRAATGRPVSCVQHMHHHVTVWCGVAACVCSLPRTPMLFCFQTTIFELFMLSYVCYMQRMVACGRLA